MDEQRLRNEDVGKERERWRQFPANARERKRGREKKGGSFRPRALLIKLSTRLSTPIRLSCFEPCRRVIQPTLDAGHCINRYMLNAQTCPNLPWFHSMVTVSFSNFISPSLRSSRLNVYPSWNEMR